MSDVNSSGPANDRGWWTTGLLLAGLVVGVGALFVLFGDQLTLAAIAEREQSLRDFRDNAPVVAYLLAFVTYVAVTGLSLPGAAALTLVYGWYFGFWPALVLVSFASTLGATVAFLGSRYLFRDTFRRRFGDRLRAFEENLEREGAFYLFTLRLVPAVPFFVINVAMGLTPIGVGTFYGVSQLGMLPGTAVYVYAGSTIPSLAQLADPSQLRPDEVVDWPRLVADLDSASRDEGPATMQHVWSMLPDSARTAVRESAGIEAVELDARIAIVDGLNELIARPDLAFAEPWSDVEFVEDPPVDDPTTADRAALTKLNRALLVAVFPETIGPSKPIVSLKLILAFVLLGVFPLLVRKAIGWFRGSKP